MSDDEPSPAQMSQVFALVALFCCLLLIVMQISREVRDNGMFGRRVERVERRHGDDVLVLACGHEVKSSRNDRSEYKHCEACERADAEWRLKTYGEAP